MRKLTCIIVDDNPAAIQRLLDLGSTIERLIIEKTFTDPKDALKYLRHNYVDFVFLDVEMEPINGLQFMAQMPEETKVVLYSGHTQYAFEGFENNAVDFLDKEFNFRRLNVAVAKVEFALGLNTSPHSAGSSDYYYFVIKGALIKSSRFRIEFDDIVYLETLDDLTRIYLHNAEQPLETKQRLTKLMEILPPSQFKRIHKSYVINLDYLGEYAKHKVYLKVREICLPVGRKQTNPDFFEWMESRTIH